MEWKSMGFGWPPINIMENNPVMFETTKQFLLMLVQLDYL